MYCNQCEQTAKGVACTIKGVCGKNEDLQSLQETLVYGLKGIAAYAYHARELGQRDEQVDAFMHEALFKTLTNVDFSLDSHIQTALKAGEMNLRTMELLDRANVENFGSPEPAEVPTGTFTGPGILVTGHDLHDLHELLLQTEGTGINIYTHGEMLPAHGYPKLRAFDHFKGHYGGAWQLQKREFAEFIGPILVTTNCVMPPSDSYRDRVYTIGITALEGVKHIESRKDYSAIIEDAKLLGDIGENPGKPLTTGFHHNAILGLADKIVEAVKAGTGLKVSTLITPSLFKQSDLEMIKAAGAENTTVAVDAATPELFEKLRGRGVKGPHKWARYISGVREAVAVFGNGRKGVGVHLIIGLGETEEEAIGFIQECYDMGARVHLFSFFPEKGSAMENRSQPPMDQYRRVQLARYLIDKEEARFERMRFEAGRLVAFGLPGDRIQSIIQKGTVFMTTGCSGCNRPYANETPAQAMNGLLRNYPFPPGPEDTKIIENQIGIAIS